MTTVTTEYDTAELSAAELSSAETSGTTPSAWMRAADAVRERIGAVTAASAGR